MRDRLLPLPSGPTSLVPSPGPACTTIAHPSHPTAGPHALRRAQPHLDPLLVCPQRSNRLPVGRPVPEGRVARVQRREDVFEEVVCVMKSSAVSTRRRG